MSESIHGVVAPRQSRGSYETESLEIDSAYLGQLAQHIAAIYPSESTLTIQEKVKALGGDNEAVATLFGEALVQVALEACQDHRLKHQNLLHLLGDIRTEVDQNIFALDWYQRPREGVLRLADGQLVGFTNESHSSDHDHYLLRLKTNTVVGAHRWEEECFIKLIDLRGQAAKRLSVYTALSIDDYSRRDFIIDGQSNEHLAQLTRVRQENRPGYDPDCYHWSTYWLAEDNDLFSSWEEFQSTFNESVHGYILEQVVKEACVKYLKSSIGDDKQVHQIQLAHNAPASLQEAGALFSESARSGRLPEEVQPDSSIKLSQLGPPHNNLHIELWQKQQKDSGAGFSLLDDLGKRTHIGLDSRGQANIHGQHISPAYPSINDHIRY